MGVVRSCPSLCFPDAPPPPATCVAAQVLCRRREAPPGSKAPCCDLPLTFRKGSTDYKVFQQVGWWVLLLLGATRWGRVGGRGGRRGAAL